MPGWSRPTWPRPALGVLATYAFWRYLKHPTLARAALAGVVLGLAQLTKFSLILLYGLWPLLWLVHSAGAARGTRCRAGSRTAAGHGLMVIGSACLVDRRRLRVRRGRPPARPLRVRQSDC